MGYRPSSNSHVILADGRRPIPRPGRVRGAGAILAAQLPLHAATTALATKISALTHLIRRTIAIVFAERSAASARRRRQADG